MLNVGYLVLHCSNADSRRDTFPSLSAWPTATQCNPLKANRSIRTLGIPNSRHRTANRFVRAHRSDSPNGQFRTSNICVFLWTFNPHILVWSIGRTGLSMISEEPKVGCRRPSSEPEANSQSVQDAKTDNYQCNQHSYTALKLSVKHRPRLSQHKYILWHGGDSVVYNESKNEAIQCLGN